MKQLRTWVQALILAPVFLVPGTVLAGPIDPGFDLFMTPDNTAFIDLGPLGEISLESNPIGPGGTDTIIERKTGLAAGEIGIIDVEIVALSLKSVNPVDVGGGDFFDIFVRLDPGNASLGQIDIKTHDDTAGAGTFDSFFDVFVQIDFALPGTETIIFTDFGQDFLGPVLNHWSHFLQPGTLSHPDYPAGGFYPVGVVRHEGPHPETISTIPEPGTFALLGLGLVGLGLTGRRKRVVMERTPNEI